MLESNFHGIIEQSQADTAPNEGVEAVPLSTLPNEGASDDTTSNEGASIPQVTQEASQEVSWADESAPYSNTVSEGVEALGMPDMVNLYESGLRRSPRLAAHKPRRSVLTTLFCFGALLINPIDTYQSTKTAAFTRVRSVAHQFEEANENFDSTCNGILHHVFSAAKEANESYTFKEMAAQDDSDMFVLAMEREIKDHTARNHWQVILRSEMPANSKTIMAIWSFKRKRFPDGRLNKHKARLCAHGGQQQWGVNYWETYAPVVNWISVRFLLIISELAGLETQSIDFVLAFPQAKLDVPVFMEIPPGVDVGPEVNKQTYVIELKSSLYGLKQASANWYDYLKTGLEQRGFKESKTDSCVFMKKGMVILCYVDDCILISDKKHMLDDFIHSLKNGIEKFEFTDEGPIDKYLGVEIEKLNGSEFILCQPYLIDRILDTLNVSGKDYNKRDVPVVGSLLGRDLDGAKRKHAYC